MNPVELLQSYAVEDVKGVEIWQSARYITTYQGAFSPEHVEFIDPPSFVGVTTHGGMLPFVKKYRVYIY